MVPKGKNWRPHEAVTVDVGDSAFRLALEVCAEAGAKHAEEVGRPDDAVIVEIRIARVPIVLDAAEAGVVVFPFLGQPIARGQLCRRRTARPPPPVPSGAVQR